MDPSLLANVSQSGSFSLLCQHSEYPHARPAINENIWGSRNRMLGETSHQAHSSHVCF